MNAVYVDTSCVVASAFGEPGHEAVARGLESFDALLASNLLAAEPRAVLARERVPDRLDEPVPGFRWILPDRPLSPEIRRVAAKSAAFARAGGQPR